MSPFHRPIAASLLVLSPAIKAQFDPLARAMFDKPLAELSRVEFATLVERQKEAAAELQAAVEHCERVSAEAAECGCLATAPQLSSGDFDMARAFVAHGSRCRAGRIRGTDRGMK